MYGREFEIFITEKNSQCKAIYEENLEALNNHCERVIEYFKIKRFITNKEQFSISEVRYLKIFALTLWNNIKVQSLMGEKLDFRAELENDKKETEQDFNNYTLNFDCNMSFYREFFWMLNENSLEELI